MRIGLLLLLAVAVARAGDEPSDADRIEELVASLASPVHLDRLDARLRLLALGESIHPLLDEMAEKTTDPEIARALREITKSSRTLRLVALDAPDRLVLGSDLVVRVALQNRSQFSYVIDFAARSGGQVAFQLHAGSQSPDVPMRMTGKTGKSISIDPGKSHPLSLRVTGTDLPALGSGPARLRVELQADALRARPETGEDKDWIPTELRLLTLAFEVTWIARPVSELERLLETGTEEERESAARELQVRDGPAIRNLLRRHSDDERLRLAAIRRLGAAGLERDFPLIEEAANDPEIRVKLAAIEALGNFRFGDARTELKKHVNDVGVRTAAIRALARHRHHETVDCFIGLLKNNMGGGAWVAVVQDTLEEWTGLRVPNRISEVQAFEKWWIENRSRWIQEQVIGK